MASPILAGVIIPMFGDNGFVAHGYLGATPQDALLAQGAQVVTEAACGASSGVMAGYGQAQFPAP